MLTKQRGVTLIALIVTVIVLLILVGISISLISGNNGVLGKSSESLITNREAKAREEVEMAWASANSKFLQEWALDTSKELSDYYNNLTLLNNFIKDTGSFISSTENADGTWTVKYKAKDQQKTYTFIMNETGNADIINENNPSEPPEETISTYTVTVNAGTGITNVTGAGTYNYGTEVTIGYTVDTGYHFSGYVFNSDITITNNKFIMPENDVIITVNAESDSSTYTITFDSNGGSGEMADQTFTYGIQQEITANGFTPTVESAFTGWNTASDGSGTSYENKESITLTKNITLYAQWIFPYTEAYTLNMTLAEIYGGNGSSQSNYSVTAYIKDSSGNIISTYNSWEDCKAYTTTVADQFGKTSSSFTHSTVTKYFRDINTTVPAGGYVELKKYWGDQGWGTSRVQGTILRNGVSGLGTYNHNVIVKSYTSELSILVSDTWMYNQGDRRGISSQAGGAVILPTQ